MSRWQDINATLELLAERFPNCFVLFERKRVPLKLGIHRDILAVLGDAIDRKLLSATMRHYCSNLHYRAAQKEGVPRIDLDGNVVGSVSEADALSAARDVILRKAAFKDRERVEIAPETAPPPPPPPPAPVPEPPKRLGLADLREAALRRKALEAGGDRAERAR